MNFVFDELVLEIKTINLGHVYLIKEQLGIVLMANSEHSARH